MMKKKGENTIGVTIAIILGIAILVFLIWGFSTNWTMFSSTAGAYAGKTNVDTVKQACELQCQNKQTTEFCEANKELIKADSTKLTQYSCGELAEALGDQEFACPALCKFKTGVCEKAKDAPDATDCSAGTDSTTCTTIADCAWNANKIVKA